MELTDTKFITPETEISKAIGNEEQGGGGGKNRWQLTCRIGRRLGWNRGSWSGLHAMGEDGTRMRVKL